MWDAYTRKRVNGASTTRCWSAIWPTLMGLNSAGICCVTTMAGEDYDELLAGHAGTFYTHWNVTNDASNEQPSTGRRFVRCSSMGAILWELVRRFASLRDRINIVDFFVILVSSMWKGLSGKRGMM